MQKDLLNKIIANSRVYTYPLNFNTNIDQNLISKIQKELNIRIGVLTITIFNSRKRYDFFIANNIYFRLYKNGKFGTRNNIE